MSHKIVPSILCVFLSILSLNSHFSHLLAQFAVPQLIFTLSNVCAGKVNITAYELPPWQRALYVPFRETANNSTSQCSLSNV